MTSKFLDRCRDRHIVVVLRTPWCSNSIQFEDLLNFWVLKNAKDVGWYKVKQEAIQHQLDRTLGTSSTLSHARQLEILVPCWNEAFSKKTNIMAWTMVCYSLEQPCDPSLTVCCTPLLLGWLWPSWHYNGAALASEGQGRGQRGRQASVHEG